MAVMRPTNSLRDWGSLPNLMIMDNDNTAWRGNSQDPGSGNPAL
jgi:hypothetical protein